MQTPSPIDPPILPHERTGLVTVTLITGSAAISGLLFGYDTAVVNGALVFLRAQFNLTAFQTELAATSLLWGCVLGAAMAGYSVRSLWTPPGAFPERSAFRSLCHRRRRCQRKRGNFCWRGW